MARSVQQSQAKEVRVFAHDAKSLVTGGVLDTSSIAGTDSRGVCLYIGAAVTDITVVMEAGTNIRFKGLAAGSFLPVLVTRIVSITTAETLADDDVIALY
jgi:hypothetical protein